MTMVQDKICSYIYIDLPRGVTWSEDNLLVGRMCVNYASGGAMAVVEINVIVQTQHMNNSKYNNSHTINDECRHTIVCTDIAI